MRHQKLNEQTDPYPECAKCKDLGDCPHPEVEDNCMGTPMCPDVCLRPIEIMKATLKKKHKNNDNIS